MNNDFFDQRKVTSKEIVNGVAKVDIYDSKDTLLLKVGTRVGEAHFLRIRVVWRIQGINLL